MDGRRTAGRTPLFSLSCTRESLGELRLTQLHLEQGVSDDFARRDDDTLRSRLLIDGEQLGHHVARLGGGGEDVLLRTQSCLPPPLLTLLGSLPRLETARESRLADRLRNDDPLRTVRSCTSFFVRLGLRELGIADALEENLLREAAEIGVVEGDVEVETANGRVQLDGHGEGHDARDVDLVAGKVEVENGPRFRQELGKRDGAFGREVGAVEEDALERWRNHHRRAKRHDALDRRSAARVVAHVEGLEGRVVLEGLADHDEPLRIDAVLAQVENLERAVPLQDLRNVRNAVLPGKACQSTVYPPSSWDRRTRMSLPLTSSVKSAPIRGSPSICLRNLARASLNRKTSRSVIAVDRSCPSCESGGRSVADDDARCRPPSESRCC